MTEAERLWARGELTESDPDFVTVTHFTGPARLRRVWFLIHGTELPADAVIVHGALVELRGAP